MLVTRTKSDGFKLSWLAQGQTEHWMQVEHSHLSEFIQLIGALDKHSLSVNMKKYMKTGFSFQILLMILKVKLLAQ